MKNKIKHVLSTTCLVFAMLGFSSGLALSQDKNTRLIRIENEIQTLSRAVFRGESPPVEYVSPSSAGSAGTEIRLQQIEVELRTLTGKVEQQNFQTKSLQGVLEKTVSAMELRISVLERQLSSAGTSSVVRPSLVTSPSEPSARIDTGFEARVIGSADNVPPVIAPVSTVGTLGTLRQSDLAEPKSVVSSSVARGTTDDPTAVYEQAFSFLHGRDYAQAGTAFQSFLDRYPEHDLAANAKYWLGETFYVRDDFERAAQVFAEAYQKYPKGPKGPDNLLKLGMSLSGQGKKAAACLTYAQLRKEYAKGAIPILARAEKEIERLGCQ